MICFFRPVLAALVTLALVFPGTSEAKAIPANPFTVTYDYDAFGILLHSTGSTPNNYLYSGEQFDPDLGLYYNHARYLNTSTGRFWSMDTEEGDENDPLSLHKYIYTGDDPINQADPSGHDFSLAEAIAVAVVVSIVVAIPTTQELSSHLRIEVHFDKLGHLPVYGDYYHAFLLVFRPGVTPTVFRAGPSNRPADPAGAAEKDLSRSVGPNEDLGFGPLTTGGCVDVPWTAATNCDFPHPGDPNADAANLNVPAIGFGTDDTVIAQLVGAAHYVDSLNLPYHPVTQNSNSFIHTLISKANLGNPSPPVHVPGWDHILY